jgi:hypothetical protein
MQKQRARIRRKLEARISLTPLRVQKTPLRDSRFKIRNSCIASRANAARQAGMNDQMFGELMAVISIQVLAMQTVTALMLPAVSAMSAMSALTPPCP